MAFLLEAASLPSVFFILQHKKDKCKVHFLFSKSMVPYAADFKQGSYMLCYII